MKALVLSLATLAIVGVFVLLLIAKHKGMHPNFDAFFIIGPAAFALAIARMNLIGSSK